MKRSLLMSIILVFAVLLFASCADGVDTIMWPNIEPGTHLDTVELSNGTLNFQEEWPEAADFTVYVWKRLARWTVKEVKDCLGFDLSELDVPDYLELDNDGEAGFKVYNSTAMFDEEEKQVYENKMDFLFHMPEEIRYLSSEIVGDQVFGLSIQTFRTDTAWSFMTKKKEDNSLIGDKPLAVGMSLRGDEPRYWAEFVYQDLGYSLYSYGVPQEEFVEALISILGKKVITRE